MRWLALLVVADALGCGRIHFDAPPGPDWKFQLPITVRDTGRTEVLADVPILIVLDPTRIDYSLVAADGSDLRFVADATVLPYEIELFEPAGQSLIWVLVPRLEPTGETLFVMFGNPDARDAQTPERVWGAYGGVWHFAESPGNDPLLLDSTGNANHGEFRGGMTSDARVRGQIGNAIAFDGVDDFIEIPDARSLDVGAFTIEGWVDYDPAGGFGTVISKDGPGPDTDGAYNVFLLTDGSIEYETNNQNVPLGDIRGCCFSIGPLHGFVFTMDAGGAGSVYIDGVFVSSTPQVVPSDVSTSLMFGRRGMPDSFLRARVDEVRISAVPQTADWIALQQASMTDTLLDYGAIEDR